MKDLTQATEHLSTLQEQLKLNHMFLQRNILYTQGGGPYDIEYLVVGGGGAGAVGVSSSGCLGGLLAPRHSGFSPGPRPPG